MEGVSSGSNRSGAAFLACFSVGVGEGVFEHFAMRRSRLRGAVIEDAEEVAAALQGSHGLPALIGAGSRRKASFKMGAGRARLPWAARATVRATCRARRERGGLGVPYLVRLNLKSQTAEAARIGRKVSLWIEHVFVSRRIYRKNGLFVSKLRLGWPGHCAGVARHARGYCVGVLAISSRWLATAFRA